MTIRRSTRARLGLAIGAIGATAVVLAGCASTNSGGGSTAASSQPLLIGTTDKITSIDPAGSYDNGSFAVMNQIYPFLMNSKYGTAEVTPDIATSASFTSPTEYTVKLKPGLKYSNGDALDSSDVKFSFDRMVKINDPNGPASLLGNLDSVSTPDATTVVFKLKNANDQTWPQVLSSPAAPIVDEKVFSADKVTPDQTIVDGKAFAGQYDIKSYKVNELIDYVPNKNYKGELGAAQNSGVTVKYYADPSNLKLDIGQGNIDVAFPSLSPSDITDLKSNKKVKVVDGPGGAIRYIVFNFDTMPYGAKTPEADAAKALAVRQGVADLIDRPSIAKDVYQDTFTPLYSYVAKGFTGANDSLKSLYGDGNGGPSLDKAKQTLQAAGVTTPVTLNLQYNADHYGAPTADEYAKIKAQLENGGLYKVNIAQTEWVTYQKQRVDGYPEYQFGWFPDFSDADNYLTPFFSANSFLQNHYTNTQVQDLLTKEATNSDAASRKQQIEQIQNLVAKDLSTIPTIQGTQIAVVGKDVQGTTLDASFKFRYAPLHK